MESKKVLVAQWTKNVQRSDREALWCNRNIWTEKFLLCQLYNPVFQCSDEWWWLLLHFAVKAALSPWALLLGSSLPLITTNGMTIDQPATTRSGSTRFALRIFKSSYIGFIDWSVVSSASPKMTDTSELAGTAECRIKILVKREFLIRSAKWEF